MAIWQSLLLWLQEQFLIFKDIRFMMDQVSGPQSFWKGVRLIAGGVKILKVS